ncbi:MAG: hypothetical protein FJ126_05475 [Deltaproteobacteria bacterium]|nr:hypothetical protein [Deltaproteobacteria bacterium]
MSRANILAGFLAVFCLTLVSGYAAAEEITATLHYVAGAPPSTPVLVSFGMPFPKGFISNANLIRVKDEGGNEIPAHVRQLAPWRDLSAGADLPSIRSALVQVNVTFNGGATKILKVETGVNRTQDVAAEQPVRSNWVLVDDDKYPGKFGVHEPPAYVTLPPAWLGRCAVKAPVTPYFTAADFYWYDDALTNNNPEKNFGQNFFRTAINDDPVVPQSQWIHYLEVNDYTDSPYEPWLYDRAMTMFTIYLRSGNVAVLREAHRAAFFYASKLSAGGGFTLKPPEDGIYDLKYSYNECLFTDLLLVGDEGWLPQINNVTKIMTRTFDYVFKGDRPPEKLWTERHLAFSWLAFIVAYEATGNAAYAAEARKRADAIFHHQNNPPADAEHGQAPNDGALMHGYDHHEGYGKWQEDMIEGVAWWIFSPFQTVLLVDAMQRYHQHSGDPRVPGSVMRFADAIINVADAVRDEDPDGEDPALGYPEPWYLASSQGNYRYYDPTTQQIMNYNEWDDEEHCLDVAKITALAYHFSVLAGKPQAKYFNETVALLKGAKLVLDFWIRPGAHDPPPPPKSIYRLAPPRKFGWWFRTTSDLDYLLTPRISSGAAILLLLD